MVVTFRCNLWKHILKDMFSRWHNCTKSDWKRNALCYLSIGTISLPFSNNCFENVADDASYCRCTSIVVFILNETKQKLIKHYRLRQIALVVVSNDIRTPGTPGSRDGHGDNDFSLVLNVKRAKFHQNRNVGQHRILQLVFF